MNYRTAFPTRLAGRRAHPDLVEFPLSTCAGSARTFRSRAGAYFRIFPYRSRAWRSLAESGRRPAVFYIIRGRFDPDHPRIPLPRRVAATHYAHLHATLPRLRALLRDFRFAPCRRCWDVEQKVLDTSTTTRRARRDLRRSQGSFDRFVDNVWRGVCAAAWC